MNLGVTLALLLTALLLGCGPTARYDGYAARKGNSHTPGSFRVANLMCRAEVGKSGAWLLGDRQAVFDDCMFKFGLIPRSLVKKDG